MRRVLLALGLICALSSAAFASEIHLTGTSGYCLSGADFTSGSTSPEGIYLSSLPDASVCSVHYKSRVLRAGDVIPAEALSLLTIEPAPGAQDSASLVYCPIVNGEVLQPQTIALSVRAGKNSAPVAEDMTFETYKNVAHSAALAVSDADGDALSYTLVKEPSRGTVEFSSDGTFTYTPKENKVGKDSFTFTATDEKGNVSNEATVKIRIVKPTDKAYYADMASSTDEYYAMWLKEQGIYTGKSIAGNICFEPDGTVGRGEFLVMAMRVLGAPADDAALTSGFADEETTPVWMKPYIVSAFRSGMISGVSSEDGMLFRPQAALSGAEAAVMLQNMLQLPQSSSRAVFAGSGEDAVPAWAQSAVSTLSEAGIQINAAQSADPITRIEAAKLLYDVYALAQNGTVQSLYWDK